MVGPGKHSRQVEAVGAFVSKEAALWRELQIIDSQSGNLYLIRCTTVIITLEGGE
jgi:hypothetical protein